MKVDETKEVMDVLEILYVKEDDTSKPTVLIGFIDKLYSPSNSLVKHDTDNNKHSVTLPIINCK